MSQRVELELDVHEKPNASKWAKAMEAIKAAGDTAYIVGNIKAGEKGVTLC